MAATHQAILGDRLRLALDAGLCAAVTGGPTFPGATTYVAALLPSSVYSIIVP